MTAAPSRTTVIVFDSRTLWHLATGTVIREIGMHGRMFIANASTPGRLWYGPNAEHPCPVHALEMPVEVTLRE